MIEKLKLDKEKLQFIKLYLEDYKKILLKEKDNKIGVNVRISCNIAELINVLNYHIGNIFEVMKYEIDDRYKGNAMALKEEYPKKTTLEIIKKLEQLLFTLAIPSYLMDSFLFGLWELQKRLINEKK